MPVDYDSIQKEHQDQYHDLIERVVNELLANLYGDRTHLIFELLQNAEDALRKRNTWQGSRSVNFRLDSEKLIISHFGRPFDEADVRSICDILKSTKGLTDIGRFGIGFKSVYAFTDRPEIHSNGEHFAIESYIQPRSIEKRELLPEETRIYVPFREGESKAKEEILGGMRGLGLRTLLFLREIEELEWSVAGGPCGVYVRSKPEDVGHGALKINLIGQDAEEDDVSEEWLIFSRQVHDGEKGAGWVEVAFLSNQASSQYPSVRGIGESPLIVFFPTVLSTGLGFLVQGPYRTTPSRDNVPANDPWNRHLVEETAILLVDAMKGLRDLGLLDVSALECLIPSDHSISRFTPLFESVADALMKEPLIPAHDGGHVAGWNAKLARGQGLRDLLGADQLALLFPSGLRIDWISEEITSDRTPELYNYVTKTLNVEEITPERLIPHLTKEFLEAQPDYWIQQLYEFLNGRGALRERLRRMPLVRLEDGSHTVTTMNGKPHTYLPRKTPTGYPTVKPSVCKSRDALAFLRSLGLRTPDLVDDVIAHVFPKYRKCHVNVSGQEYEADVDRLIAASKTDSTKQRENLLNAFKKCKFVSTVDAGHGAKKFVQPDQAYMPTERLTNLFQDVPGVLFLDDTIECLNGKCIRSLLRNAGTSEHLSRKSVGTQLSYQDKLELRGGENYTSELGVEDYTIMGLGALLQLLDSLPSDEAATRARILWKAFLDVRKEQTSWGFRGWFNGYYRWFYYTENSASFPARFTKTLNEVAWVTDTNGKLCRPSAVVFRDTGWEEDSVLTEKVLFKPDAVLRLAEEVGIEAGILDLLKERGITTEEELKRLLGMENETDDSAEEISESIVDDEAGTPASDSNMRSSNSSRGGGKQTGKRASNASSSSKGGQRKFVSYVEVSNSEDTKDPDGLSHQKRMELEKQAIDRILEREPHLKTTPPNNRGFDLTKHDARGNTVRWIEVKGMKGTLGDYPVTMTRTEFKFAQKHQDAYWLYIVEKADDKAQSKIICIKDPAGKAQSFSFDQGWAEVAENPN